MNFLSWFVDRLKEPSTYAGFAGVAVGLSQVAPEFAPVLHYVAVGAGAVGVAVSEGNSNAAKGGSAEGPKVVKIAK